MSSDDLVGVDGAEEAHLRTPWFIRTRLQPPHWLLLDAIGDAGDIDKAAKDLKISRPAASDLLDDLEGIIGSQLFDRLEEGVRPNWYGKTVIRQARSALAMHEADARDQIKITRADELSIGAISGPAISLVPTAIARVTRDHPQVRLRLQVGSSDQLTQELLAGRIDLMVGRLLDSHDASNLNYQRLSDEPVCAVARKGHPLLKRRQINMEALATAAWIVPQAGSIVRHRFNAMFTEAGFATPKQIIEAVSQMLVIRLLEETNHLAILTRDVAEYYASFGTVRVLPIELPCPRDPFGIVTRKDLVLSPAARSLCAALEAEANTSSDSSR
ncbi:MAG TPA: LysR family transcriptional regulator [Steroidobacteraceae bacterium]|nr:LysR family transcriptional regulator [Steroidobacteraceae bacterium]